MPLDDQTAMTLRRDIYGKGAAIKTDLSRLLDMSRAQGPASEAFADLLAEVATDVLVNEVDPPKYIGQADADWLVAQLTIEGGVPGPLALDMLTRVIRSAVSVPPSLAAFGVTQIERAIVSDAGRVTPDDLEALRIVVYAATQDSALHVTRESAEALFRIADATIDADNDPAFDEFFAQAIGNYLMGVAFRWTSTAAEAKRIENWLDAPAPGIGGFFSSMLDFSRIPDDVDPDAAQNAADAEATAKAEVIDAGEADWLIARLRRDGVISNAERRLLRFLRDESPAIAPALSALMESGDADAPRQPVL